MLLAVDDPAFNFFIGLSLLRRHRTTFLLAEADRIPEIIQEMKMPETEIDDLVSEALDMYHKTPRCFCRNIRLCCVNTPELTPVPFRKGQPYKYGEWVGQTKIMCAQSARQCLMLTPQDLISYVSPLEGLSDQIPSGSPPLSPPPSPSQQTRVVASTSQHGIQFVIIDIRSDEDIAIGGSIPRSILMDPEFLTNVDGLAKWIEHFDGTKGCHIVLIDVPPVKVRHENIYFSNKTCI
jgi:hypothetical protein